MHAPNPSPPARPSAIYRWMIFVMAVVILIVGAYRWTQSNPPVPSSPLRKISILPPFALNERGGRSITNRDLSGKIWVADFVYTTCPGPCPAVTAGMAGLQKQILNDPQVQLVTFTVDPVTDTPAVLARYADAYGADPNRWWFLTGSEKQMYDLIQNGFLQAVQDNRGRPPQPGQYTVTHSTYLALVDGDGVVRGFYNGNGPGDHSDLLRDIKILEQEETP